jgi:hypothetical protein
MSSVLTTIFLEKGFLPGLEILSPPADDEWWKGVFAHFKFKSKFNEIAKEVPKMMADKSIEQIKWTIESTNRNEPVEWNDSNITFFSDFFIRFLMEKGKHEHFHSAVNLEFK